MSRGLENWKMRERPSAALLHHPVVPAEICCANQRHQSEMRGVSCRNGLKDTRTAMRRVIQIFWRLVSAAFENHFDIDPSSHFMQLTAGSSLQVCT